jgi:hypothetical protein
VIYRTGAEQLGIKVAFGFRAPPPGPVHGGCVELLHQLTVAKIDFDPLLSVSSSAWLVLKVFRDVASRDVAAYFSYAIELLTMICSVPRLVLKGGISSRLRRAASLCR